MVGAREDNADEVRSVALQMITYNGNQQSAYGSIHIDFDFERGEGILVSSCFSSIAVVQSLFLWPARNEKRKKPINMVRT